MICSAERVNIKANNKPIEIVKGSSIIVGSRYVIYPLPIMQDRCLYSHPGFQLLKIRIQMVTRDLSPNISHGLQQHKGNRSPPTAKLSCDASLT